MSVSLKETGVKMAANCELLFKKEAAGQSILMLSAGDKSLLVGKRDSTGNKSFKSPFPRFAART